jgi:ferredoxin
MVIKVDQGLCQGHGQCEQTAPEVFEVRDDGLAYVVGDAASDEVAAKVQAAVRRCPVDAITLTIAP